MSQIIVDTAGEVRDSRGHTHAQGEVEKQQSLAARYSGLIIDRYQLLDDAYRASGGFEDGTYLIPHPSEGDAKYIRRKKMCYFVNYVKPIVDALVNPIFRTDPVRSGMGKFFEEFTKDVDGNGTTLTRFMKKAAIRAKLHGVEFVVIDMEPIEEDEVLTEKRILEERIYPYVYLVSPSQITDWATNKFGKLVSISYKLTNYDVDKDGQTLSKEEIWTWTATKCKKVVEGIETIFENQIGEIPIVPLYGAINDSADLIPNSDVMAISRTNLALFNACSELRERNSAQAFSVLSYPIADDDSYEEAVDGISIGTADMLMYRSSTGNSPEFITPPPDSSDMLLNEIQFMVKEIYRMASLRMTTDSNTYNVSAVAMRIMNQQYYQSITELAHGLQEAEKKLNNIFSLYMGDINSDFEVSYNQEYSSPDPTEVLNSATTSLALGMTPEFNKEMRKQVAKAVLEGVGTSIINNVLDSIEKSSDSGEALESEATVVQPTRN